MTKWGKVLFIEDEEDVRIAGVQTLELEGYDVTALESAVPALDLLDPDWPGMILSDVRMPRLDGLELLSCVKEIDTDLPVVLVTGHGDIAMAAKAIRDGAYDFVEKPAPPEYLIDVVGRALEKRRLVLENRSLKRELGAMQGMESSIIGQTPVVEKLRKTIADLANTDVDVLINGETGTGKELVARSLHDFGSRAENQFVALNCGALPESIIESELFGHEAGAFTGANRRRIGKIEFAEGGTLFLDEIESMPPSLQIKILRVLQERTIERLGGNEQIPVDIRVVAASKIDLRQACDDGSFREDLFYRLHVANIDIPPLRNRAEDVPILFQYFAAAAAAKFGRNLPEVSERQLQNLSNRSWPGNVRELRNAAERFVLGMSGQTPPKGQLDGVDDNGTVDLQGQVAAFERTLITEALTSNKGRVGQTAEALGIPRKTLYLRMQKLDLKRDDFR